MVAVGLYRSLPSVIPTNLTGVMQHTAGKPTGRLIILCAKRRELPLPSALWVRLSEDVDCGLRRGGWYAAISVGHSDVVLEVRGRKQSFHRHLFEISPTGPTRWTIVANAGNSARIPSQWSRGYAVCPSCRWRQLLLGHPATMRCEGCYEEFQVDWDELYLNVS